MGACIGEVPRLAKPARICLAENGCGIVDQNICCIDCQRFARSNCMNPCRKAALSRSLGGSCWYTQELTP